MNEKARTALHALLRLLFTATSTLIKTADVLILGWGAYSLSLGSIATPSQFIQWLWTTLQSMLDHMPGTSVVACVLVVFVVVAGYVFFRFQAALDTDEWGVRIKATMIYVAAATLLLSLAYYLNSGNIIGMALGIMLMYKTLEVLISWSRSERRVNHWLADRRTAQELATRRKLLSALDDDLVTEKPSWRERIVARLPRRGDKSTTAATAVEVA